MRRDRSGRSRPVAGEPSKRTTKPKGRNSVDPSVTSASPAASDARPPKLLDLETIALQQTAGRAWLVDHFSVSRETLARLDTYVAMLTDWQTRMNLVAPSTLGDVWRRHVADSLSLERLLPEFSQAVDLGSGGGLPALVIAASRPHSAVDMVESSRKKAAFLAAARAEMGVKGSVHPVRIEAAGEVLGPADVVTARALASLDDLLSMVAPHISRETHCFFQKGRSHEQEIATAAANWQFTMIIHESQVEADSVILEVAGIARRQG